MKIVETKSFKLAVYEQGDTKANNLAVIIPGRLDTKDYAHLQSHANYLAGNGYFAIAFDPPGTWESPGNIDLYTTGNTIKAINELIEYYGNKPTILIGHSRGGVNAMLAGCPNELVTHIIAMMSFPGVGKVDSPVPGETVHMSYRDLPPGKQRTAQKKEFALPVNYFAETAKFDPRPDLSTSHKPKLFFYGTKDELISEQSVRELYNLSAEPKMIYGLNCEHDYRLNPEIIDEVNGVISEFLNKYKVQKTD